MQVLAGSGRLPLIGAHIVKYRAVAMRSGSPDYAVVTEPVGSLGGSGVGFFSAAGSRRPVPAGNLSSWGFQQFIQEV
jgi:hypothetical protein